MKLLPTSTFIPSTEPEAQVPLESRLSMSAEDHCPAPPAEMAMVAAAETDTLPAELNPGSDALPLASSVPAVTLVLPV